jgi:proteasome accessory factor C
VSETGDGGLVVRLRTGDTDWVRRLALRLGAAGRVLAPDELAEQVRQDAARALAAYAPA